MYGDRRHNAASHTWESQMNHIHQFAGNSAIRVMGRMSDPDMFSDDDGESTEFRWCPGDPNGQFPTNDFADMMRVIIFADDPGYMYIQLIKH
jgi:hypothetical protein